MFVVLRLNIPVNNFSVMSGLSQHFLGLTSTVGSYCVLLKDTTRCRLWGSNPGPLDLESDTLPLCHRAPWHMICSTKYFYGHSSMINPYLTSGFSHHYHLEESTLIFRGVRSDFYFLSHFSMKFLGANRIAPDGTPHSAASHLGLFCLLCPIKGMPGLNELKDEHMPKSSRNMHYLSCVRRKPDFCLWENTEADQLCSN